MKTLADAWGWYRDTKALLRLAKRLADHHWDALDWDGPLGCDPKIGFEATDLRRRADAGLDPLDDLAILVLFSVFEAIVRDAVGQDLAIEARHLRHVSLRHAARAAIEQIDEGSFFRVLEPFKELDAALIEQVNQVRRYRNWVAHGRKGRRPDFVDPEMAYERLNRFLEVVGTAPSS